ncbi:COBRA-like protein 8 [Striga hermonthica]|uniref:COBRA-like protein 8 n=1 Tax=Striga hermonthica TaxID=68872 RepID=A0A9N7MW29_STRHE|nr:COBRA-like protein 8 [Striga hermonthica]
MAAITATLFLSLFLLTLGRAQSQTRPTPAAPPPASDACVGIFLSYSYEGGRILPPIRPSDPARQPYRFQSSFTVLNNDAQELKSWRVFVGFQHDEYLVSATNAVLADGSAMPGPVGNGSVFAGFPNPDLKTGIDTAGDLTQMGVQVELVGTQFGVVPPDVPMPANISLVNDRWICPRPRIQGNRTMQVCCTRDPNFRPNTTLDDGFLPRQNGDLTIMYDVTRTYSSNYWAQVTIENHSPLGRLDNWQLSWDWMEDEFIFAMRGAYPSVVDTSAINWHVLTDYRGGWSARVTLFNWDDDAFADWFTAVELNRGGPGFEAAYSFNGTAMGLGVSGENDTIFMQGLPGLNYLVGEVDGEGRSRGLRVPGKQQSVISFTKRRTPGINVSGGDGFPTKVYFNGEECSLPDIIPTSGVGRLVGSSVLAQLVLGVLVCVFMRQ